MRRSTVLSIPPQLVFPGGRPGAYPRVEYLPLGSAYIALGKKGYLGTNALAYGANS